MNDDQMLNGNLNSPGLIGSRSLEDGNGGQIPEFKRKRDILKLRLLNMIVRALNPLQNIKVSYGESFRVIYSRFNVGIQIPRPDTSDSPQNPAGASLYRICHKPDTDTQANPAVHSDPLAIDIGNWFWAQPWDGTNGGIPVPVAKYPNMQQLSGRTYRGITSTFSYTFNTTFRDWVKSVHITSPAATYPDETQLPDPPYLLNDEILVTTPIGGTGVMAQTYPAGVPKIVAVTLQDITPRGWASVGVDPPP